MSRLLCLLHTFGNANLGRLTSIELTVNALQPRQLPRIKFFGSDKSVQPLRQRWTENKRQWYALDKLDVFLHSNVVVIFKEPVRVDSRQHCERSTSPSAGSPSGCQSAHPIRGGVAERGMCHLLQS